ncbi:MAG: Ig-like domain-containing protein, partial [Firmicutes bacterium]|nr:Ig-like domain-containing protein [Bacillota bacterium]
AINATTVQVVLAEAPATELTNADAAQFAIKVNGASVDNATAVAKLASDLTGKTYRLTIATLAGQQGSLSVNGTEAAVAAGKAFAFDFKVPEVTSIVAKGTTSVEVTFNEKLDPAATNIATTNFTAKAVVGGAPLTTGTAVLDATGTKVTLTFSAGTLTVADYVLVLGAAGPPAVNVQDVAGNGIYNGTEVSFRPSAEQLQDKSAPALTKAIYDSVSGKLTLTLNKNVTTADVTKMLINDYRLTANDVSVIATNTITITLSAASKTAVNALTGTLTLTSEKDAYGDATAKTNGETFTIAKQQPALISSAAYNQETNILAVTFDMPVTLDNATFAEIGVADGTKSTVTQAMAVETPLTTARATWTFDCSAIAATYEGYGNVGTLSKIFIQAGAVKNEAGVANVAGQETYAKGVAVTYTADVTKPVLSSIEWNNNIDNLVFTFSEKIDLNTAAAAVANIKLWEANGVALTGFTDLTGLVPTEGAGTKTKTLTFALTGPNAAKAAAIELAINTGKTVKATLAADIAVDEAGLKNVATTYATGMVITYKDYDAPAVNPAATASNQNQVVVQFNEPVDKTTAETLVNYTITDSTAATLAISKAVLQAVNTATGVQEVYLTTATQTANAPYTITVKNIKDLAGNLMATGTATFNGSTKTDVDALTVDALAVAAPINSKNDTLTVTFNAAPDVTLATNVANYVVLQADTNDAAGWNNATQISLTNATAAMVPGTPTQVKITLDAPNLQNNKWYKVVATNITTVTGKALGTAAGDNDAVIQLTAVAGPAKPAMTVYQTAEGAVKLVFAEELQLAPAQLASNYTVTKDADGTPATIAVTKATYTWNAETKKATVILDLASAPVINVTVALDAKIVNLAGVSVVANPDKATTLADNVAPSVDTVVAKAVADKENDVITITFKDSDILKVSAELASNYVVKDAQGNVIPSANYEIKFTDGTPDVVTLTFKGTGDKAYNLQDGQNYSVTVKDVVDTSGNTIAETTKTVTWDAATDKTAPTLGATITSVTAATNTITVTWAEDVDATTAATAANYKVEYSALGTYADTVTYNVIFASYSDKVATLVVSGTLVDPTTPAKLKVTATNVKDLAGNTQTTGTSSEKVGA